jgi:hypothetical protein
MVRPGWAWIYFGNDAGRYFALRETLGERVREIPAGPLLNEIADQFRADILNFDEALEVRDEVHWQATDLAERNVFSSGFVHACCCALALERLLRTTDDELLVVVDDVLLGRRLAGIARTRGRDVTGLGVGIAPYARLRANLVVRGFVHRLLFLRRLAATRRAIRRRLDPARPRPELDVLLVTWADPETFPAGAPVDNETYFGTLPGELRAKGRRVGFLANLTTWVHPLDDILRNLASAGDPIVVPEEAVRLRDALSIVMQTLTPPARLHRRFAPGGLDLSGLIIDELRREWAKPRQLWALQFFHLGRFLAEHERPGKVIFPFENQPWEKTLRLGLRDAMESVGSQHTPVSERWFPYFPSRRDLAAGQLPDSILTIGPLWRRLFASHGYPPERLAVAQPLRYRHLTRLAPARPRSEGEPATVVVACSIGLGDSLELLVKAVRGVEALPGVRLRVKLHPKLGVAREDFVRDVLQVLRADALPSTVAFVDGPVAGALRDADLLLYNTTSVSYEAIAAGMPIVFVASDFWFDVDPVPPGSGVGESARTPAEIRAAVERALGEDGAAAERRRERGRRFLDDAFA